MNVARSSPPLVSLIAQFESATAEARFLARSTTEEIFTARPDGNRWSAAECIAHLSATNRRYLGKLEPLAAGLPPSASPRYRPTLVGRLFKSLMEPPVRMPLPAPTMFVPEGQGRSRADILAEFEEIQARIVQAIQAAGAADFASVTVRSPVSKLLKMNLWDAFQIMAAHERRHLWQARRTMEAKLSSRA